MKSLGNLFSKKYLDELIDYIKSPLIFKEVVTLMSENKRKILIKSMNLTPENALIAIQWIQDCPHDQKAWQHDLLDHFKNHKPLFETMLQSLDSDVRDQLSHSLESGHHSNQDYQDTLVSDLSKAIPEKSA